MSPPPIEKLGSEYQKIYTGVVFNQLAINGKREDHVTIAWDAIARKEATNATSLPALSSVSYMKTLFATFSFGAAGRRPRCPRKF